MGPAWTVCDSGREERDPQFVEKAGEIIELELPPPSDGPTFLGDEKTGRGVREPSAPRHPVAPDHPARRAFEYVRHGTADLLAAFALLPGLVDGIVRRRPRSAECIELLRLLDGLVPKDQGSHLLLAPVRLPCSAEGAVDVADRPWRFPFPWRPVHGLWLSFIEVWFAILSKTGLDRSEWADFDAAAQDILAVSATDNAHHAHPFTWRKGIKFYQRLKDKLANKHSTQPAPAEAA